MGRSVSRRKTAAGLSDPGTASGVGAPAVGDLNEGAADGAVDGGRARIGRRRRPLLLHLLFHLLLLGPGDGRRAHALQVREPAGVT